MGEQEPGMSPPMMGEGAADKPVVFAPRIDTGLREQVEGIKNITGQTINEIGQEALQDWVTKKLGDESVRSKAMAGIEEEERRIKERKAAIAKVLGSTTSTTEVASAELDPAESTSTKPKPEGSNGTRGGRGSK